MSLGDYNIIQLLAGVRLCAELVLAKIVFEPTNVTNTNSIFNLVLLPTVVFSIFIWFGRGLIFAVREDIKDLSIPYFKRKETKEEQLLREVIAIKEVLQQQGIREKQDYNSAESAEEATRRVDQQENINEWDVRPNILTETPTLTLANESSV